MADGRQAGMARRRCRFAAYLALDGEMADDGMVFRKQIEKTPDGVVGAPKWGGWSRDSLSAVTLVEAEPRPGGFPKTDHEKS